MLAALAAIALLAGCGGDGNGNGETEPDPGAETGALAVTLTDTECTYSGPESVPAGPLSIALENESAEPGRFDLLLLQAGAAPEDLVAYVEGERLVLSDGGTPTWPPTFASVADRVPVPPRGNSSLGDEATAGAYGVVCFIGSPPSGLYLATTFRVAS
jgi:hypothetical protein